MSGGLGRGQGGYDEMVWRAKVRDNDKFYSPLGLEAARYSSKRGCRADWAADRVAMTKWCGAPRSATTTNSTPRWGWRRRGILRNVDVGRTGPRTGWL